ncbi:type IV toxin-antitoxin system AbiEi family antitoxin domain-containing protein [Arthrobacter ginkgonis]|uniref:type IV toxin-antitoxin system AbiEi family antitoxin domain-containing protein n=1 Tax=Arthrobacter ginkgonis TaxID=1630594 RepID=UPI0031E53A21
MRTPKPLPEELRGREFTSAEAAVLGVPRHRLRAGDLERVAHGIYRERAAELDLFLRLRALTQALPGAWVSHHTAGTVQRLWLPSRIEREALLHLSRERGTAPVRRPGVVGHTLMVADGEVACWNGFALTTKSRTWLDLARYLELGELVAIGDQLIRIPRRRFEGRSDPYATREGLAELVGRHPNLPGVRLARAAIELMRVGSDSAKETELRLAILAHGLPEPRLQVPLDPADPYSFTADLGYEEYRLALQYDGVPHRFWPRKVKDNRRNEAFVEAGWRSMVFDSSDAAEGFRGAVARIGRYLVTARERGAVEPGRFRRSA